MFREEVTTLKDRFQIEIKVGDGSDRRRSISVEITPHAKDKLDEYGLGLGFVEGNIRGQGERLTNGPIGDEDFMIIDQDYGKIIVGSLDEEKDRRRVVLITVLELADSYVKDSLQTTELSSAIE